MAASAGDVEVVDFEPDDDDLMDEDAVADADASPTAPAPKLRSAVTGGASSFAVGETRKTKGRGFREEARPDRGNRLAAREFDSLDSDGGPGPQRCVFNPSILPCFFF